MKGLRETVNVITVIELSAKIASIYIQYSRGIKYAAEDIDRLQNEIKNLQNVL